MRTTYRRLRLVSLATLATLAVVAASGQAAALPAGVPGAMAGHSPGLTAENWAATALATLWAQSPGLALAAAGASRLAGAAAAVNVRSPLRPGSAPPLRRRVNCDAGSQMDPNGHCL